MGEERRQSPRAPVQMTADLYIAGRNGDTVCGPVKGLVADLNSNGACLCLSSMQVEGTHLFYSLQDESDLAMILRFSDSKARRYTITCRPVWFNKELDEEPVFYRLGLIFTKKDEKEQIKLLHRIAKGREKSLATILSDFFRKRLIRAS